MHITQRLLLTLLGCSFSSILFAQVNVDIEISGINKLLENNVRLLLSVEQQKRHPLMSEGRLRRLHKKAPKEITNALQPFGYYRPVIKAELTHTTSEHWRAIYTIDPGPPLLVGQFDFSISGEMVEDAEFRRLSGNLPLRNGDVFNHLKYEKIKTDLVKLAAERGYVNARFTEHRVVIDLEAYEARITLHYEGGPRYRFGDVQLKQDVLEPELLQRFIPFERGDPYSLYQLIDLQQALTDSDYFHTVEVLPDTPLEDNFYIPISVNLTPRKRHRYSFGLGYGTDTGGRTSVGWEIPRVNKRGHRVNTNVRVSEIGYSLGAYYRVPQNKPRTDQLVYSIGEVKEKTDASDSTLRTVGISLNRSRGHWRESLSLNYQQEDFIIGTDSGLSTLLMPSVNWTRIWGQNFISTFDGLRFDINFRGSNNQLISDTGFFQAQGGIKAINRFGSNSWFGRNNRLISRGLVGSTWAQDFHDLPSSVRFFAGGAQSVRGYAYQDLAPVDVNGNVEGGRHLLIGSIEWEHQFTDQWGSALFYDAGNALENLNDKLEQGAGFGLRWQSPVGPVRIDIANAISKENRPWRLHISIGPDL